MLRSDFLSSFSFLGFLEGGFLHCYVEILYCWSKLLLDCVVFRFKIVGFCAMPEMKY